MSKQFQFADFVDEFQVSFVAFVESTGGYYNDDGDWVEGGGLTPNEMVGIWLPLSEDDLRYSEAGTYSVKDKKIYTTVPLQLNQIVEYKGDKYTVQNFKDYSDYADVYIYYARWREK